MRAAKTILAVVVGAGWIGCGFLATPPLSIINAWLAVGVLTGCAAAGLTAIRMAIRAEGESP